MVINIENIWKKSVPEIRDEIVTFWETNKMLPPGVSGSDRVNEVVLVARNESGNIVGISSAAHIQYKQLNDNYFFAYRSIILPQFRQPGLAFKLIVETRQILEDYASTMKEKKCIGMVTFVENKAYIEKVHHAVWPASKMIFIGNDKLGRQIRLYYFKGAMI